MLQITYDQYNSSWNKFLLAFCSARIAIGFGDSSAQTMKGLDYNAIRGFEFSKKTPFIIGALIRLGYHVHNLYSEYEYNKSLEIHKKLQLENNEIIDVKQATQDWNIFTVYNVLGGLSGVTSICNMFFNLDKLAQISIYLWLGAKLLHIHASDIAEYKFTNLENGSTIDINTLIHGEWVE